MGSKTSKSSEKPVNHSKTSKPVNHQQNIQISKSKAMGSKTSKSNEKPVNFISFDEKISLKSRQIFLSLTSFRNLENRDFIAIGMSGGVIIIVEYPYGVIVREFILFKKLKENCIPSYSKFGSRDVEYLSELDMLIVTCGNQIFRIADVLTNSSEKRVGPSEFRGTNYEPESGISYVREGYLLRRISDCEVVFYNPVEKMFHVLKIIKNDHESLIRSKQYVIDQKEGEKIEYNAFNLHNRMYYSQRHETLFIPIDRPKKRSKCSSKRRYLGILKINENDGVVVTDHTKFLHNRGIRSIIVPEGKNEVVTVSLDIVWWWTMEGELMKKIFFNHTSFWYFLSCGNYLIVNQSGGKGAISFLSTTVEENYTTSRENAPFGYLEQYKEGIKLEKIKMFPSEMDENGEKWHDSSDPIDKYGRWTNPCWINEEEKDKFVVGFSYKYLFVYKNKLPKKKVWDRSDFLERLMFLKSYVFEGGDVFEIRYSDGTSCKIRKFFVLL